MQKRREAEESRSGAAPAAEFGPEIPERVWTYAGAGVLLAALALRVYALEMKPLHHDEGVNGHFLIGLFREGVYKYDPANYHGPDLYYIALAFTKIFGLNTLSVRWSVAVFGVLTVVLAFFLRKHIGKTGGSKTKADFEAVKDFLRPNMVQITETKNILVEGVTFQEEPGLAARQRHPPARLPTHSASAARM